MKPLALSKPEEERPINPAEIFDRLTLRGPIENIWTPQSNALKKWHALREEPHIAIEMSTGGGKTLVGLLVAQSLVNETEGQVLYLCPTNQLVEQTCRRAVEIGLSPATRSKGEWVGKSAFDSGGTFCVTNYHSFLNGRSVFRDSAPDAIVFDDAHVSEHIVRDQFTLSLPRSHDAFEKVLRRLLRDKKASPALQRLNDILDDLRTACIYVPSFVVWEACDELRAILLDAGVARDRETMFPWAYIKDNDAVEGESSASLEDAFDRWVKHWGLVWPALANSLESRLAMDLMYE